MIIHFTNTWRTGLVEGILTGANLTNVNLWNCAGNGEGIRNIVSLHYPVTYTVDRLQIGCKNFGIEEWKEFDDVEIERMDGEVALKFWHDHSQWIFKIIKECPVL